MRPLRRHGLPRRRRIARLRRGVYLMPSLLTTTNIFCGFASIVLSFHQDFQRAAVLIVIAGVLDGLDGRIARLMKATTEFGGEYDSLADVVSFGLAPAFLIGVWGLDPLRRYGWLVSFLFLTCGAVRLARFNIQHGASDRRWFVGLPIPMAATVVASSVLTFEQKIVDPRISGLFAVLVLLTSLMMVSRVRYRSFKDIGFQSRRPFRVVVTIAAVLAAIAINPPRALLAGSYAYLLFGPASHLLSMRRGARSRAARADEVRGPAAAPPSAGGDPGAGSAERVEVGGAGRRETPSRAR